MTPAPSLEELLAAVRPRLLRLARGLLPARLRAKLSEEDVVASAVKSWLNQYGEAGQYQFDEHGFWYLLACIVRRKVVDKRRHYDAAKRSAGREVPIRDGDRA